MKKITHPETDGFKAGPHAARLIAAAREAAENAYCPYSKYPVGAAVLAIGGRVFTGCNIENASYGLSNCAERTAVFKAVSEGCREFIAIAICGGTKKPAYPCGACRQVLAEFCEPDMPVFIASLRGKKIIATTVGKLLPFSFGL